MSMSFTNRENSVIDEPRREKTGIQSLSDSAANSKTRLQNKLLWHKLFYSCVFLWNKETT